MTPPPVLIIPGWTNSGPEHWQSRWQEANSGWTRVEQQDWDRPVPAAWIAALDTAVVAATARTGRLPVLVGHSLGALLVPMWAAAVTTARAAGALLVAPADVEQPDGPAEIAAFAPVPRVRLPFPALLAASRDDPFLTWERAQQFAERWGASLHDCGRAGHLNTAAGYGPWPDGERLLAGLMAQVC